MEEIERIAEGFLAHVPGYVWNGQSLPVPIEDIADTHVELVRDADDLSAAPGASHLDEAQSLSDLLLPALGEIWVTPAKRVSGHPAVASRSRTSSATGPFTDMTGQCSAAQA
jgi:hypothetical protein